MNANRITRIADPAVEPLTLADAKQHLRVDESADDAYITALITAARQYVEDDTGLSLITQDWELRLPRFPWQAFRLNRPPLQSLVSIKYLDADEVEQTVADPSTLYRVFVAPGWLIPVDDFDLPDHLASEDAVRITWRAGYGDAAADVPETIRQALKLVLGALYERRGDPIGGTPWLSATALPDAYRWLIGPVRRIAV